MGNDGLDQLEADTYAFWRGFANRPGGAQGIHEGVSWFRSGIRLLSYNGLLGSSEDVDGSISHVRSWNTPARWMCSTAHARPGFDEALTRHGCELTEDFTGMVADAREIAAVQTNGVTVTTVRSSDDFATWLDVFADAFRVGEQYVPYVRDAHEWPCLHDARRTYLLFRVEGEPVATGLLHDGTGVAGVYGIAVRRACQGRGLGEIATRVTVREGVARGATLAVLQATREGFPLYKRLGFQTLCSFQTWTIVP